MGYFRAPALPWDEEGVLFDRHQQFLLNFPDLGDVLFFGTNLHVLWIS